MEMLECQDDDYVTRAIFFVQDEEIKRGRAPQEVYMRGNCGNLYRHLKQVFHCATPYVDQRGHIKTKIGGQFYDINSVTKAEPNMRVATESDIDSASDKFPANKRLATLYKGSEGNYKNLWHKHGAELANLEEHEQEWMDYVELKLSANAEKSVFFD